MNLESVDDVLATCFGNLIEDMFPKFSEVVSYEVNCCFAILPQHFAATEDVIGGSEFWCQVLFFLEQQLEPADGIAIVWDPISPRDLIILVEKCRWRFSFLAACTGPAIDDIDLIAPKICNSCPGYARIPDSQPFLVMF
jgi:hypothetical protein